MNKKLKKSIDEYFFNALVRQNSEKAIELIKAGANLNRTFKNNGKEITLVMYLIDNYNYKMAELLIMHGAEANADSQSKNGSNLSSPLERCVAEDMGLETESLIRTLVAHGADINIINNDGLTPLSYAVWRSKEQMVDLLLELGAKLSVGLSSFDDALIMSKSAVLDGITEKIENALLLQSVESNLVGQTESGSPAKRVRL